MKFEWYLSYRYRKHRESFRKIGKVKQSQSQSAFSQRPLHIKLPTSINVDILKLFIAQNCCQRNFYRR